MAQGLAKIKPGSLLHCVCLLLIPFIPPFICSSELIKQWYIETLALTQFCLLLILFLVSSSPTFFSHVLFCFLRLYTSNCSHQLPEKLSVISKFHFSKLRDYLLSIHHSWHSLFLSPLSHIFFLFENKSKDYFILIL